MKLHQNSAKMSLLKEKERLTAASRIHLLLIAKDEESAKVTRNEKDEICNPEYESK